MTKKIVVLFAFIISFSFTVFSQDVPHLVDVYDEITKFETQKNYHEVLRLSKILITNSPLNSELHLLGYLNKAEAENKLGDYRNSIISASKALELDTRVALMIRQADLPYLTKKMKNLLYLTRGFAKESIGLIESSEADYTKAKELN